MTATTATTATTKLNRFNGWVALMAFSCVVLGTLVNDFPMSVRGQKENYIIACCVIAIFLGFVAMNMYMFFETHIGTIKESSFAVIAFALWCAAIAIIQNPKNSLAVFEDDFTKQVVIRNTNLYFFSWASFITSAYVLSSISQDHDVVNVRNVPLKLTRWYLLMVCSVVVLGISSRLKSLTCSGSSTGLGFNENFDENRCRRTDYAISFGVVTTVLTFVPIILSHCGWLKSFIEVPVAVVILAFYCVGVAVITDTVHGPASNVGNLYFASWIGFYLAISLGFTTMKETFAPTPEEPSPDSESNISKSETRGGKGDAENVAPVRQDGGDNVEGESGEA